MLLPELAFLGQLAFSASNRRQALLEGMQPARLIDLFLVEGGFPVLLGQAKFLPLFVQLASAELHLAIEAQPVLDQLLLLTFEVAGRRLQADLGRGQGFVAAFHVGLLHLQLLLPAAFEPLPELCQTAALGDCLTGFLLAVGTGLGQLRAGLRLPPVLGRALLLQCFPVAP